MNEVKHKAEFELALNQIVETLVDNPTGHKVYFQVNGVTVYAVLDENRNPQLHLENEKI